MAKKRSPAPLKAASKVGEVKASRLQASLSGPEDVLDTESYSGPSRQDHRIIIKS
jgi:hypothetical protein